MHPVVARLSTLRWQVRPGIGDACYREGGTTAAGGQSTGGTSFGGSTGAGGTGSPLEAHRQPVASPAVGPAAVEADLLVRLVPGPRAAAPLGVQARNCGHGTAGREPQHGNRRHGNAGTGTAGTGAQVRALKALVAAPQPAERLALQPAQLPTDTPARSAFAPMHRQVNACFNSGNATRDNQCRQVVDWRGQQLHGHALYAVRQLQSSSGPCVDIIHTVVGSTNTADVLPRPECGARSRPRQSGRWLQGKTAAQVVCTLRVARRLDVTATC